MKLNMHDWNEVDEDDLKLLALKLLELGLKEIGLTLGEFVEFVQDMEDRDS